jgi:hypothetical protein
MSPGMVNTASEISDRIGHIMNYGDGWYGGVYVAAMYSLAFISDDIEFIVSEALRAIPAESNFYKVISDVIRSYHHNPDDWKETWFVVEKKWTEDIGCPDGVFQPFNIDASVNAAYVVIGLLFGKGDFTETMQISTRCGQDADCNPATAGGILGTVKGYSNIPDYWKQGLDKVENLDFSYTDLSLNDVYQIGYNHAVKNILRNNGTENDSVLEIALQVIKPVRLEVSFEGIQPVNKIKAQFDENHEMEFEFEGTGISLTNRWLNVYRNKKYQEQSAKIAVTIDGNQEVIEMPYNVLTRRQDFYWNYQLTEGNHTFRAKWLNPDPGVIFKFRDAIIYAGSRH